MRNILLFICLAFTLCACDKTPTQPTTPTASAQTQNAETVTAQPANAENHYVGSAACQYCHALPYQDWLHSDHHRAMMPANAQTVLGNFASQTLEHHQQKTQFTHTPDSYNIATDSNTNTPAELTPQYTFGVFPLQQYLTSLPDGRLQSLPFAWDARATENGGQRWFHLYTNENIVPGDALHWRSPSHNANHMCIECHSTDFAKNYDTTNSTFHSTWQETGIGCESCHGPGANHLAWARSPDKTALNNKGWDITLTSGAGHLWQHQTENTPARRTTLGDNTQVERCAQCHSRRSRINTSNHEKNLLDAFSPSLLEEGLYYADGQIQDEVYEYGSFMQSRMHQAGVTCSNCHNPHSGKLKIEGNGLCLQCHNASYDSPQHHMHTNNTQGSFCVDCHMPATTYMGVDARRDHSLRIPRPDLSKSLDAPNACNRCHIHEDPEWAIKKLDAHFGEGWKKTHYGEMIQQARLGQPAVYTAIEKLISDNAQPAIVRATAVSLLPNFHSRDYREILNNALGNSDALIRLGAVRAAESLPPQERETLIPLLQDSTRAIRIEAARLLSDAPATQKNSDYSRARQEYIDSQHINSDRAPAPLNLAALAMKEQRWDDAEKYLLDALQKEPYYIPAAINLADFYRLRNRDAEARNILLHAIQQAPDNADLQLAYGLWLVRNKAAEQAPGEACAHLQRAAQISNDPYFHYVYALALQQQNQLADALAELDNAAALPAYSRDIEIARVDLAWQSGDKKRARAALLHWQAHDPQDPALVQWEKIMREEKH